MLFFLCDALVVLLVCFCIIVLDVAYLKKYWPVKKDLTEVCIISFHYLYLSFVTNA